MDATRDHRRRISAAVQVDGVYDDYEIEMMPAEALSFAATSPVLPGIAESVYVLIDVLNHAIPVADFGPNHPRTGVSHHKFRVGRQHGDRLLVLELFKGYFASDYPFDELLEKIQQYAESAGCSLEQEGDETGYRFIFLWARQKNFEGD
jgi:hypothetical protein